MRNLDEAKYPTAFAAKVWDLHVPTARLYVNEYLYITPSDRKALVSGATTLLTARRVMQGAIGAELASSFRTAALACEAAKEFTDFSEDERDPGELYGGRALTALVAYPDGTGMVLRVNKATDKTPLNDVFFPRGHVGARISTWPRATVLLLDFIVRRVHDALDRFDRGKAE